MKKNDGEKPPESIKHPCNSQEFDMITDYFLPGVCGIYQMYPEISQDLMWYPELLSFNCSYTRGLVVKGGKQR